MPQLSSDEHATVANLRALVREFVDERDWQQFHTPKNLSMALAIEAAELMEHFQWLTAEESQQAITEPNSLSAIGEELADVLCYGLALANTLKLDISTIMQAKMEKNRQKYPVQSYRGRFGPDDPRPPAV